MNPSVLMLKEGVLPLSEAFQDAGIVILVVFGVLVIMCLLITLSGKILQNVGTEKKSEKASEPAASEAPAAAVPAVAAPEEEFSSGTLKLKGCDEKTAAMIMAIVSDNTGIPLSELVFKSITLVEEK